MSTKLTLLGTGTFFVSDCQTASVYLLEIGDKKILVDCGPGTLVRLSQIGVKPQDINYIFITHFHADHTADLFPLIMNIRLEDFRTNGINMRYPQVFGPKGIKQFVLDITRSCELPALSNWDKIAFVEVKDAQTVGSVKVNAFDVKHIAFGLEARSCAYRFVIGSKILVFSGDMK